MAIRILLLPGMSPDVRIYDRIVPQLPSASVVPWIRPLRSESIPDYARRLAASISVEDEVIVCGVSFGGIIARDLALRLNAKACVLISSVRDVHQLPPWFRVFRPLARFPMEPMLYAVGAMATVYPRWIRTHATARLRKLAGDEGAWHRWATASVLRWKPARELDQIRTIQIHGDRDQTFPIRYIDADVVLANGGHVLPLTHPDEIAGAVADLAS